MVSEPAADAATEQLPADAAHFTLDSYADQLKRARQLSSLSSLLPKAAVAAAGGDSSVASSLKRQEDVIR